MTVYHGRGRYGLPAAMTESQIAGRHHGFAESAGRAIEVAGLTQSNSWPNGYLLDHFDRLTPKQSRSVGRRHGDRAIDPLETFKAVRARSAAKVPVAVASLKEGERLPSQVGDAERDAEIIFAASRRQARTSSIDD